MRNYPRFYSSRRQLTSSCDWSIFEKKKKNIKKNIAAAVEGMRNWQKFYTVSERRRRTKFSRKIWLWFNWYSWWQLIESHWIFFSTSSSLLEPHREQSMALKVLREQERDTRIIKKSFRIENWFPSSVELVLTFSTLFFFCIKNSAGGWD